MLAWLTVLGGCIGSFLNVVIYRLPRGESLTHPGSHCPKCGRAIRWYHNVPVVAWIVLRGRCHDCRAPISIRYPVVEGTIAAMFFVLALTGPLSESALAAAQSAEGESPRISGFWLAFALEAVLLCALFALAIIDRDLGVQDEGRFPLPLVGGAILLAVVVPILVPATLVYVHAAGVGPQPSWRNAVEHAGVGLVVACGCGCLMLAAGQSDGRGGLASVRWAALPAVVGPYLGAWPTVAIVATAILVFGAPQLVAAWRLGTWWRWPLVFWAAALVAMVTAHVRPAAYARFVDSRLAINFAVIGSLLVSLVVLRVVSRRAAHRLK
jgi:prepilin signal peptidase PulO-like enzyme (type II secretory pathway)